VRIEPITPEATRPLRRALLRPGQPEHELVYPGDDHRDSLHLGAFTPAGDLVGIASYYRHAAPELYRPAHPALAGENAWQLRGMATVPEVRGEGVGARLLLRGFEYAISRGGDVFWCNARLTAQGFYERLGLTPYGEVFDPPGLGKHIWMWRLLDHAMPATPSTPTTSTP